MATYFFKKDSQVRVEEVNLKLAEVIGLKVESDLKSTQDKLRLLANFINNTETMSEKDQEFVNNFFQTNSEFLMLGKFKKDNADIESIKTFYNSQLLDENQIPIDKLTQLIKANKSKFTKSFASIPVVINLSQGFPFPILGMSIPAKRLEESKVIFIAFFKLDKLLNAFTTPGITKVFMVNRDGILLADYDMEKVLVAKNLSDYPLFLKMSSSEVRNGLIYYQYNSKKFIGSFQKIDFASIGILCEIEEAKAFEEVYNIQRRNIYIMLIVLFSAMLIVLYFARTLSKPILQLVDATKKLETGNFDMNIQPTTRDEIGILTDSFIRMGHGLEERVKVKNILGSMVDPTVVREAMIDLSALKQGTHKEITAFFSDIADFTAISEELSPSELAALLNEYLSAMTIILKKYDGVLDKYVGDAIVAIFNAPVDIQNHHLKATKAALEMIEKLEELKNYWKSNKLYTPKSRSMKIRIGLNTGYAKVGFMGTDDLASYTMMGDTVNVAARLESAGKDYGVNILISEDTKREVKKELFTRELDMVQVKGKNKPVKIFELINYHSQVPKSIIEATKLYERALKLYKKKKWDEAIETFETSIQTKRTNDKAAELLIDRCIYYKRSPPPSRWNGVFARKHK